MIQILMLVSLGFFAATLLALLIAPAAWARAVRLTSHRIRASLPINETEIRAEKDQLRATHAVVVHQLEKKIERAEMSAARQRVELNRRDARIVDLEGEKEKLTAQVDENRNARHVLAQTLNERLPRAEERLRDTRELLKARDSQVAKFVKAATQQHVAMSEAVAQLRQQDEELKRLKAALMARQYAVRQRVPAESLEQTAALQSEVRELRERTATQSRLLERIQEAERTQMADAEAVNMVRETDQVDENVANAAPAQSAQDVAQSEEPQGFAARFNRWRVALNKEKETTARLRVELANAHDRAAKLSAHYRDELKGLSQSGVVSVPLPGDAERRSDPQVSNGSGQTSLLARATANERTGHATDAAPLGMSGSPNGHENGTSNGNEQRNGRVTEAIGHGEAPETRSGGNGSSNRGIGTLTERIKKQSGAESRATRSDELDTAAASVQSNKSGTLLQRLKGMEE